MPLPAGGSAPSAADRLLTGLLSCAEVINLSDCGLSVGELGRVYADLLRGEPALFHVAPRLAYLARQAEDPAARPVVEVYPVYTLTGEALTEARSLYRHTITEILTNMEAAFAPCAPTEAEVVLYLHDYLAARYAYDTRPTPNADAYTLFRDGVGVCQAYALAYLALLRGAGLEADFVASEAMNHAWNHVRVEGVWYHVDVTRDDPIPSEAGREAVNHSRILRSDAGMQALGYHGYTCAAGHTCTDTRYEDDGVAALEGIAEAAVVVGGRWVAADANGTPTALTVGKEGISLGGPGDVNNDSRTTPADLLRLYHPAYPATWRERVRRPAAGDGS